MNKINKQTLLPVGSGLLLGTIFLVINLLYSTFEKAPSTVMNVDENIFISIDDSVNADDSVVQVLTLFGFNIDVLANTDNADTLSAFEDVSVRIIAQSSRGGEVHTLFEIVTPKETKRIVVTEGTVVNGFLIKSISNKQIVLEKNKEEYTVKLFHPKELNQNRIKNDLK